jgi:plastocyanin
MKKYFTLIFISLLTIGITHAVTHTITNSGYTFVPASISISTGDSINFILENFHNAVQVSKTTWDANGNTSNGGFSVPYGGGKIKLDTAGVYYYVCQPHASLSMKGTIIVLGPTGIASTKTSEGATIKAYPNPASQFINVDFFVPESNRIRIDLIDITGKVVGNLLEANYNQGNYKISVPLNDYSGGRYFVRYTNGNEYSVYPVIIEKLK